MAPIKAEQIIEMMEANKEPTLRPDAVTYTTLVKCWIESGRRRAAERAEEIINMMHRRYDEGHVECKPDSTVYNVVMDALAKSDAPDSAERAEALLNRMQDHYYAGDSDLAPTTVSFSTAIQAWARSSNPEGAARAQALLRTMHDLDEAGLGGVAPNTIVYSTCILAWRNSRRKDAGKRADALLEIMEGYQDRGLLHLGPNAVAYTNAMEAWTSCRQPESLEKVEGILERMIERSDVYSASEPTTMTMNVVMKAIQYSLHPKKHEKAERLLNRMKEMHARGNKKVKPSIVTYNTVSECSSTRALFSFRSMHQFPSNSQSSPLQPPPQKFFSACAMTEGSRETRMAAFSLMVNALVELQESKQLRPDAYTWPAVWKACQNQLDFKTDSARINRMFELTVKSGSVNELLFNNMRRFLPPQYLQKKLKTTEDVRLLTVHDLPPEWTCNVKLGRKDRRRSRKAFSHMQGNATHKARPKVIEGQ